MPISWTAQADRAMFLAILDDQAVKIDFDAVAEGMVAAGFTCTPRAVQQHIARLKKTAQDGKGASYDEDDDGDKQTTKPKARGRPRKKQQTRKTERPDGSENDTSRPLKKARLAHAQEQSDDATEDQSINDAKHSV